MAQTEPPQPADPPVTAAPTPTLQQSQPDPTPAPALLPDGLDLLGIFSAQVKGHLVQARAMLEENAPDAADTARNDTLRRIFHTIKGAARAIGFIEIRDAAAAIEELFRDLVDRPTDAPAQAGESLTTLARCALDCIETILARHIAGTDAPSIEPLRDQVARYRRGEPLVDCAATGMAGVVPPDAAAPEAPAPETRPAATSDKAAPSAPAVDQQPPPTPDATTQQQSTPPIPGLGSEPATRATGTHQPARHTPGAAQMGGKERANIAYEQLDRLYRLSGELTVSVSALSGQGRQMRTLALQLSQAQQQLNRINALAQTDGLARETLQESLRGIIERLGRAGTECATLTDVHDRMESRLQHLSDDLVDEVTQARLVPLSELLYAFPMSEVAAVRRIAAGELREVEGRMAVHLDDEMLLLYELHQVLGLAPLQQYISRKHLLVLGDGERRYGLLADEVIDEMDMVSRPLDQRLGKVRDVSGLTLLDDGGVALIVDIPDLLARMDEGSGRLFNAASQPILIAEPVAEVDHILVVEDSVTVREVERHFLEQAGYQVSTAVNGIDGLNKAKAGNFNLLITDIDMPRMNGIELIRTLRGIDRFKALPIIVVSYKDRTEDRQKTLEAGADRYVTKSEFDTDAMPDLVAEMLST